MDMFIPKLKHNDFEEFHSSDFQRKIKAMLLPSNIFGNHKNLYCCCDFTLTPKDNRTCIVTCSHCNIHKNMSGCCQSIFPIFSMVGNEDPSSHFDTSDDLCLFGSITRSNADVSHETTLPENVIIIYQINLFKFI